MGLPSEEKYEKGEIVVLNFPFSNLESSKTRPALIIANLVGDDILICEITSRDIHDKYAIKLMQKDFQRGNLRQESIIRPNKLFTADKSIIDYRVGIITEEKQEEVKKIILNMLA